jgi:Fe-Mn family superoxide dismutase
MLTTHNVSATPDFSRRRFLKLAAAGASLFALRGFTPTFAQGAQPITLPPLPYPDNALAPVISANTIGFH